MPGGTHGSHATGSACEEFIAHDIDAYLPRQAQAKAHEVNDGGGEPLVHHPRHVDQQ